MFIIITIMISLIIIKILIMSNLTDVRVSRWTQPCHALQLVVLHWAPVLGWRMQHGSLPTQRITGTLWGLLGAS